MEDRCPRCNPPNKDEKVCFECEMVLPLSEFGDNPSKYQVASNRGKNYCCKQCVEKRNL